MTDNNTPQAQAKAPMTTDDVLAAIQALTAACQALTHAIEAADCLEAAKEANRGNCNLCRYHECGANSWPCNECFHVHQGPVDHWSPM